MNHSAPASAHLKASEISRFSLRRLLSFLGPAFIVSVAYVDPGNFATNISGGSSYAYSLLWVILWSNIMAIVLQMLSAKLGLATGKNLAENCRDHFRKPAVIALWVIAEIAAMATDLAEFLGAALGFHLLFGMPMLYAGLLTGGVTFFLLWFERYGQRIIEYMITSLVALISLAYVFELMIAKPDWRQVVSHTLLPSLPGDSILVAVGMLGATVMPHVIYLHSHLVQPRRLVYHHRHIRSLFRWEKIDILIAMNIAFIINAAMVIVSAAVFYRNGMAVTSIEQAHASLGPLLGELSSYAFGIALLASGLSSSAVGTMAGQVVMKGFLHCEIPLWLRRLITMLPALLVIAVGFNPLQVLVISQVTLSFALPAAIIPLLLLTSRKELMGDLVNSRPMKVAGWLIAAVIIVLNGVLLYQTWFS